MGLKLWKKIFNLAIAEAKLVNRTKGICKDNLDVFEQFYNENSDIYNEISDKLLSIKKAKTLIKIR